MKHDWNHDGEPTPKEIAELIARYRASGLGLKDFARQHGISPGRLHYWLYQKRGLGFGRGLTERTRETALPVFQELRLGACTSLVNGWAAEVSLARGRMVRFSAAAAPAWIGAVVEALDSLC